MGKVRAGEQQGGLPQIHALMIEGFKSIDAERRIEIRPLTILAGANSSGKSSAMQPLLLMKQTLEAAYDPGPLLLNGPNVKFTALTQLLPINRVSQTQGKFSFGIGLSGENQCAIHFRRGSTVPIELDHLEIVCNGRREVHTPGEIALAESYLKDMEHLKVFGDRVRFIRDRCFLLVAVVQPGSIANGLRGIEVNLGLHPYQEAISHVIHVPGLRGNPQRNYPLTAVGDRFPGTFNEYVASVIASADSVALKRIGADLDALGLTWKVQSRNVDDTQVELQVGRLPKPTRGGEHDLVSIADVGFGVSQTLPVVVALLTAKPGQLVYIEQPEIHLHPRAQVAMASLLARAAQRGVRVVIETHSSLLLLGVQQLIAEDTLDPALVKLHWFKRDETTGMTEITSADLDSAGAFGDWPEDFDDVTLAAQQQYLDAAEKKLAHEPQEG